MENDSELHAGTSNPQEKLLFLKISLTADDGKGQSFTDRPENVDWVALFDGAEDDDAYTVEHVFMSDLEWAALPEFTGF